MHVHNVTYILAMYYINKTTGKNLQSNSIHVPFTHSYDLLDFIYLAFWKFYFEPIHGNHMCELSY